jgi:hypothetical protein
MDLVLNGGGFCYCQFCYGGGLVVAHIALFYPHLSVGLATNGGLERAMLAAVLQGVVGTWSGTALTFDASRSVEICRFLVVRVVSVSSSLCDPLQLS